MKTTRKIAPDKLATEVENLTSHLKFVRELKGKKKKSKSKKGIQKLGKLDNNGNNGKVGRTHQS